ncbi:MAG: M23 family metallopeptidase [Cryobacterium sp.]|uniref:M23 family metallopeptidase n=1 Tax=Cryobacterium sp. TaxID=1926290 RepID=UPI0022A5940C|nr:M23 family metallopeptidase [Cryobacterium sp.]MCY7403362.1 M23 family metallopeptidase [Cryobacterium sp.]
MTIPTLLGVAAPAAAMEYPSWSDVESTRSSEAGTQAQVTDLTALIAGLTAEVDAARAEAPHRATTSETAQSAFDGATLRATNLQDQADAAAAAVSGEQAVPLAASLARSGNSDLPLSLFSEGPSASDLLNQLGSYGNWVLIDHGDGTQTGYAHNSSLLVSRGQQVSTGATVALVGTTGASSGGHVHSEMRVDGARVNPQPFMSDRGVTLG